jgi:hypothetical protein
VNNAEENHFKDGKLLAEGSFPQTELLYVYSSWGDQNEFTEHGFLSKMTATSLKYLSKNHISCRDPVGEVLFWPLLSKSAPAQMGDH